MRSRGRSRTGSSTTASTPARSPGRSKMTPIIVADGAFNAGPVTERFREASADIEPGIASFVFERLKEYPSGRRPAGSS